MGTIDDERWAQLTEALGDRPGWSVQDAPTPGAAPIWTFSPGVKVTYSVVLADGDLFLYEEKTDSEAQFESVERLVAFLDSNEETARKTSPPHQPLMRWR